MEAQGGFLSESESESENDFYCHIEKFITAPSSHINEPIDKHFSYLYMVSMTFAHWQSVFGQVSENPM